MPRLLPFILSTLVLAAPIVDAASLVGRMEGDRLAGLCLARRIQEGRSR